MLITDQALALNSKKYSDSQLILQTFTKERGPATFILADAKTQKRRKSQVIAPMTVLEIVYQEKQNRQLYRLREFSRITPDMANEAWFLRQSMSQFAAEVVLKCIYHGGPDQSLFEYLSSISESIYAGNQSFANFHIQLLQQLSAYLGFLPSSPNPFKYFDLREGVFSPSPPIHADYLDNEEKQRFHQALQGNYPSSKPERLALLDDWIKYYQLHVEGFKKLNSLEVLRTVFA